MINKIDKKVILKISNTIFELNADEVGFSFLESILPNNLIFDFRKIIGS